MWSLEAMKALREVPQQEPVVQYTDRPRSSSSSAKSASGILSSVSLLLSSLRKWGYSIFPTTLSAKLPDFVEDIRKSHRRRVNRHTAPIEQPRFVILGNTGSAAAAVEDFQKYGMGPHYLISEKGDCIQLVEEQYMAWCCNFAFWKSANIGTPNDVPNRIPGVGIINELKTYAVSIFLEGDGEKPYDDKQYTTLVSLLREIRTRWKEHGGLPPWNVLSAGEVEQRPPECPAPGKSFDWSRLVDEGFTLEVNGAQTTGVPEGLGFKDALQSRLREWGYEFGDSNDNTDLMNRMRAFRHRYIRGQPSDPFQVEFSEQDFRTITELLRLRSLRSASKAEVWRRDSARMPQYPSPASKFVPRSHKSPSWWLFFSALVSRWCEKGSSLRLGHMVKLWN